MLIFNNLYLNKNTQTRKPAHLGFIVLHYGRIKYFFIDLYGFFVQIIRKSAMQNQIRTSIFVWLFLFTGFLSVSQNRAEQQSFAVLSDYLDNHSPTDSLYFSYLQVYENQARRVGSWEQLSYVESKYAVHSPDFEERLQHAQELLSFAQEQNNPHYIGIANNLLALVYYIERDMETSLHYELLAEEQLAKTDDLYNLHKSRYGIATIYHHLGEYEKALPLFTQAADYYESQTSYNDLMGYLNSIRYMGRCYFGLQAYHKVDSLLAIGVEKSHLLKPRHQKLEGAYFYLLQSENLWAQQQFDKALSYAREVLPAIQENDDFANEHLAYLYMGKSLWGMDKKDKAIVYFEKIDDLYREKQYSNIDLLEAYEYLLDFYKDENNPEQQLFYTEQLLGATQQLQNDYKGLSHVLLAKYEIKELENSRAELQKEIRRQKQGKYLIVTGALILIGGLAFYGVRRQYRLRKRFERLRLEYHSQRQQTADLKNKHIFSLQKNEVKKQIVELKATKRVKKKTAVSEEKREELLDKLRFFEEDLGFLDADVNLKLLAERFDINTKYLSEVINSAKGLSFPSYLNQLRIDYAINQLDEDKKLRKFKMSVLAKMFGFSNARSFTNTFNKVTGLKFAFYLTELKKEYRHSSA